MLSNASSNAILHGQISGLETALSRLSGECIATVCMVGLASHLYWSDVLSPTENVFMLMLT